MLDYFDVSKKIKQSNSRIVAYLFDKLSEIPEDMFSLMKLNRSSIENNFKKLIKLFK